MFSPASSEGFCSPMDHSSECYSLETLSLASAREETPWQSPAETDSFASAISHSGVKVPERLPWWCVYIAWALVMSSAVVCSYIVMLYGLRYGYNKSVAWLISFFTCFFKSTSVITPLKVAVTTAVFSAIFTEPAAPRAEYSSFSTDQMLAIRCIASRPMVFRRHAGHLYRPPKQSHVNKVMRKLKREKEIKSTFIDVLVYVAFTVLLGWVIRGHASGYSYWVTKSCHDMIVDGQHSLMKLNEVRNTEDLYSYLNQTFIPATNTDNWPLTLDEASITLGQIRVRQHRIKPNITSSDCHLPEVLFKSPTKCRRFHLSDKFTDKATYDIGWKEISNTSQIADNSPWQYQEDPVVPQAASIIGHAGYYHGYMAHLPNGLKFSRLQLEHLRNHAWLDDLTRHVSVEASLYYPALHVFCFVQLQFEFNDFGLVTSDAFFRPVNYMSLSGTSSLSVITGELLYLLFTVIYTVWEGYKLYRARNYGRYFHNGWIYVDILVLLLSYSCIPVFIFRVMAEREAMMRYSVTQNDFFVNLHALVFWSVLLSHLLAFLLFFVMINSIKLLRFNKRMVVLFSTFEAMASPLVVYFYLLVVSTVMFVAVMYPTLGRSCYDYQSFSHALMSIFSLVLTEMKFNPDECAQTMGPEVLFLFLVVAGFYVAVLLPLIQAILNFTVSHMVHSKEELENELQLLDYLWGKIMVVFGCWKISKYNRYVDNILRDEYAKELEVESAPLCKHHRRVSVYN